MSEHIFILDSNSQANVVVGVVPWPAPRAPTVKAPDFEKPLRGEYTRFSQTLSTQMIVRVVGMKIAYFTGT